VIISEFSIRPCILRKEDPNWRFALGASPTTNGVVVQLTTKDGHIGYGYASATAHMGSTMETLEVELNMFRSHVIGRSVWDVEALLGALDRALRGAPQAKAAIDCALYDVQAQILGLPLNQLFGGKIRDQVPILRILAIKTPAEMAAQAQKLYDKGYRYFKIKVHGEVGEDVARVKAIRQQLGAEAHLTIDANQSYSVKDAVSAINQMAEFGLDLAEQPVHVEDREGLALVTRMVPVTIEADEAAGSLREVYELVSQRVVDAVSLKIPKLGGLRNTIAAARICEAGGIKYRFGAAVGSRLMSAHALHLACALPGVDYACELGEFDRLLDDPFEGIEIDNGILHLPEGKGSGVRPVKTS
jgi:L-alanine-DL-glutamate epimerase-like enolase superfamily enzyme